MTIIRAAAGTPTGGQFAAHVLDDAPDTVALTAIEVIDCPDCGHSTTAEQRTASGLCIACEDENEEFFWCRECDELVEQNGEGFDGYCGNCADIMDRVNYPEDYEDEDDATAGPEETRS